MGLKVIITSHSTFFNCSAGMNSRWHPEISEKPSCYLPYGKADGTASPRYSRDLRPALSRACGKLLQLHPWRLGSAAPSTVATLGYSKN